MSNLSFICALKLIDFFLSSDDEVVEDEQDRASAAPPVHGCLVRALGEAHHLQGGVQLRVPDAQCLPQAVEGLEQAVHLAFSGNDEAQWLAHVYLLLEVAIQEGGLHVHVVH